jgi:WD40 repeat protein
LRFLSPERLDGISDRRSDIYSLGMTLYEMLALRPAFDDASKYNVIEKIRIQNPERLKSIDVSLPRDLVTIVEKAIEKEPLRRYASAQAMAEDLELFLAGRPIRARRVSQWEYLWSWSNRNRGIAASLACIALLVITGLIASSIAAYKFRNMAIEQKRLVGVADKESNENQQNLYYAEMKLGIEATQSPQGRRALSELLANWKPQSASDVDRRGFEWYWLNSNLNPDLRKVHDAMWTGIQFNSDGSQMCRFGAGATQIVSYPDFKTLWYWNPDGEPNEEKVKLDPAFERVAILSNPEVQPADTSRSTLVVLDWTKNETLFELKEGGPISMAWSHDGTQLAILVPDELPNTEKCSIKVFSTRSWKLVREFKVPHFIERYASPMEFGRNGKWLALGVKNAQRLDPESGWYRGEYGMICYDTGSWEIERSYFGQKWTTISKLDWHSTKPELAVSSLNGSVIRWNVEKDTSREITLPKFTQTVAWDRHGTGVIVAGDGAVMQLDLAMQPKRHWKVSETHSIFAEPHPSNNEIVVSVREDDLQSQYVLSPRHESLHKIFAPAIKHISHGNWEGSLFWSPDGKQISSSLDAGTTIWDAATGDPAHIINEDYACSIVGKSFGWNPENEIVTAYSGKLSFRIDNGEKEVRQMDIAGADFLDSKGRTLYAFTGNRFEEWKLVSIDLATSSKSEILPVCKRRLYCQGRLCPSDRYLAMGVESNLTIVDLSTKSILHEFDESQTVTAIAWSHDGEHLAYAVQSGEIVVRKATGAFDIVARYSGHSGRVIALAWTPDGTRLASGGMDKVMRLWDTSNGKNVIVLKQEAGINAVAWDQEGQRLATLNFDGFITIYDATSGYRN